MPYRPPKASRETLQACKSLRLPTAGAIVRKVKSSRVPPQGWSQETFRTRNGRELIKDMIKSQRASVTAGMRRLIPELTKYFDTIWKETERRVEQNYRNRTGDSLKSFLTDARGKEIFTMNPDGHEEMWMGALDTVMRENDLGFINANRATVQSVVASSYDATRSLLWKPDNESAEHRARVSQAALSKRTARVASRISGMNDTTRNTFNRILVRSIGEGNTVAETAKILREEFPRQSRNRVSTIARTELGQAADEGRKQSLKDVGTVTHVSVIGCEAREANSPTYRGESTCNIEDVPIEDVDELEWHPNHTGTIVPSRFVGDDELEEDAGVSGVEQYENEYAMTEEEYFSQVRADSYLNNETPIFEVDGQMVDLYHGTSTKFDAFSEDYLRTGADAGGGSWYGDGAYLSGQGWKASSYSWTNPDQGYVATVHTNIKHPFVVRGTGAGEVEKSLVQIGVGKDRAVDLAQSSRSAELTSFLRGSGYDSVLVLKEGTALANEVVVFDYSAVQIKKWQGRDKFPSREVPDAVVPRGMRRVSR